MKEHFIAMLGGLRKDELKALLVLMNYYPEEPPVEELSVLKRSQKRLEDWQRKKKYYSDDLKKKELLVLLKQKIYSACKLTFATPEDSAARKIVEKIAEAKEVMTAPEMSIRDIENEILRSETEDYFPINLLAITSMRLMSQAEQSNLDQVQAQIVDSLINSLILTGDQKEHLISISEGNNFIPPIRELVLTVKRDNRINSKRALSAILGFSWSIALSDGTVTLKEMETYNKLSEEFDIRENAAIKIKNIVEKNYEEIARLTREELQSRRAKIKSDTLEKAIYGVTGSIVTLGLAEAAGFGLFLFSTSFLKAISLLLGITVSFSTYTTLTTVLGVLTGPVGWIGIPAMVAGGVILKGVLDQSTWKQTGEVLIRVAYLRGDI